jgi:hypothetical protein
MLQCRVLASTVPCQNIANRLLKRSDLPQRHSLLNHRARPLQSLSNRVSKRTPLHEDATAVPIATRASPDFVFNLLLFPSPEHKARPPTSPALSSPPPKLTPLPPKLPPMLKLPQPLPLPMILIQHILSPISMLRAIVTRTILSIVAATRAIRVRSVRAGSRVRSQRVGARIRVVHVEGEVVCLGSGESERIIDAEELV